MPQEKVRPKLLEHRVALGPTFSRCPPLIPLSTFAYSELGLIVIKQFWLQCIQSEMKGGGGNHRLEPHLSCWISIRVRIIILRGLSIRGLPSRAVVPDARDVAGSNRLPEEPLRPPSLRNNAVVVLTHRQT